MKKIGLWILFSFWMRAINPELTLLSVSSYSGHEYTLINSVDIHPTKNLFCVSLTHNNKIALYKIDKNHKPYLFQTIQGPVSLLSNPQHALFSPDGEKIVVANWTDRTFTVYPKKKGDFYSDVPLAIIQIPEIPPHYKPHGIAFSPCGNFLAAAFGASYRFGKGIALFQIKENYTFSLSSFLHEEDSLYGIPKGIAFSPNGDCLLVTFCESNSLVIYDIDPQTKTIRPLPRQILQGREASISRPEDVKISPDGSLCVVSNSDKHTLTFYAFDKKSNLFPKSSPCYILQNPQAGLTFPHGIAFSPDGSFLLVTQFGSIQTNKEGDITWDARMDPRQAKINLYQIKR